MLPLKGSGKFTGNFSKSNNSVNKILRHIIKYLPLSFCELTANSIGKTRLVITKTEKNGEEYFHMEKMEIKITVGKGMLKLQNLFNGDRVLGEFMHILNIFSKFILKQNVFFFIGDAINEVINQNFAVVSQDVIPLIEKALQRTFKKTANKITSRYTFQQLLPK